MELRNSMWIKKEWSQSLKVNWNENRLRFCSWKNEEPRPGSGRSGNTGEHKAYTDFDWYNLNILSQYSVVRSAECLRIFKYLCYSAAAPGSHSRLWASTSELYSSLLSRPWTFPRKNWYSIRVLPPAAISGNDTRASSILIHGIYSELNSIKTGKSYWLIATENWTPLWIFTRGK